MLILLPPSEGKSGPGSGPPLNLTALSLPELTAARQRVLVALESLCRQRDVAAARTALGLGTGQLEEIRRNARLRTAGTAPAGRIYTGVLYNALDLGSLNGSAYRTASRSLLIWSGLWGVLRIDDPIPPYRCRIGTRLPGPGPLGGYWRTALSTVLPGIAETGLILDLRSAAYAAMWQPRGESAERTVVLRVLHERTVNGVTLRSVVSHLNKATKGRLVRDLLTDGAAPDSPARLVEALRDLKYTVDPQPGTGRAWRLDVTVTEL